AHQMGGALRGDPLQRAGDGRVRSRLRGVGPHPWPHQHAAAAGRDSLRRIRLCRSVRGGFHVVAPCAGHAGGEEAARPARAGGPAVSVRVERLSKQFAGAAAVSEVSFAAPSGAITTLLGPSGSGKTTLLRLIAGLAVPDAGRVLLD